VGVDDIEPPGDLSASFNDALAEFAVDAIAHLRAATAARLLIATRASDISGAM
jgi:hypothetical protein